MNDILNTAFIKLRGDQGISLLGFADEDWQVPCFEGKGLVMCYQEKTAQPKKEEAVWNEVPKPWIWTRFETDLTSAFTSYQRKLSVTKLLAQTWKYRSMRGLYTHVLQKMLAKPSSSIKNMYLLHTPHWVFFSLNILLSSQRSGNIRHTSRLSVFTVLSTWNSDSLLERLM